MTKEIQMPSSDSERRRELLSRNFSIWINDYSKGNFVVAKQKSSTLYKLANEWGTDSEILASILITKAWSEYYVDKNGTTKTNASYLSAQEGLAKLQDLENTSVVHEMRSSLLEVAGLCQAYLVDERDEKAERLFRQSVEEAERSGFKTVIGEAKNGFALWLISPAQKRFVDAIPLFQEVAKVQKEEGNRRGEGHAHNNLVVCHTEIGKVAQVAGEREKAIEEFEKAVEEADKALELYANPDLNHSFSARFRKSLALRGLGKEKKDKTYFEQALAIYELHKELRTKDTKLSSAEKTRLIANEEGNITKTREEMKKLGFV